MTKILIKYICFGKPRAQWLRPNPPQIHSTWPKVYKSFTRQEQGTIFDL